MEYYGDLHTLRTFDGEELHIPDEQHRFLVYIGYGAPPIDYITRRGYKQHGVTKVDYLLSPREITIQLWKKEACSRVEYWNNRLALHDLLRPNRGGSMELILTIPDGSQKAIIIDPNPGATFTTPQTEDNSWSIEETLSFICFNPIWYDPNAMSQTAVLAQAVQNLVFPITFPITFGAGGSEYTITIQYEGSWKTYPRLILTGPYTTAEIENLTTGVTLFLTSGIVAGQSRIIDLTPGSLSIVDQDGVDKFSDLGDGSNLVDWNIRPHPEVTDGINVIRALIDHADTTTTFTVEYNERFEAI